MRTLLVVNIELNRDADFPYWVDFPSPPREGDLINVYNILSAYDLADSVMPDKGLTYEVFYVKWDADKEGIFPKVVCIGK